MLFYEINFAYFRIKKNLNHPESKFHLNYEICSDNPSEYGDDDIASDDDNDHHDNDNLDETFFNVMDVNVEGGLFRWHIAMTTKFYLIIIFP
jgi:hypothetical protein